jgi:hypothetical protein
MVRRPKLSLLLSLLLVMGICAAVQYPAAQATGVTAARPAAAAGAAGAPVPPLTQICDARGSSSLCANRAGGGLNAGTNVIAWTPGDFNNQFAWGFLGNMCNHGTVSANPPCPFTPGGGLNSRYNGAFIGDILDSGLSPTLCVADNGAGTGATVLNTCPDFNGNGGANGTIFILPQVQNPMSPATTYAVNRFWSDNSSGGNGRAPRWLCVEGRGQFLFENESQGAAGICQWNQVNA